MINYLDLSDKLGKPVGIHLPVLMWAIEEQEIATEPKAKIIAKATVTKVWALQLVVAPGIAVNIAFESEKEARQYLNDKILNV